MKVYEVFDFLSGGSDIVKRNAPTTYNLSDDEEEPRNWGLFVGGKMIARDKTRYEVAVSLKNPMLLKKYGKTLQAKKIR